MKNEPQNLDLLAYRNRSQFGKKAEDSASSNHTLKEQGTYRYFDAAGVKQQGR